MPLDKILTNLMKNDTIKTNVWTSRVAMVCCRMLYDMYPFNFACNQTFHTESVKITSMWTESDAVLYKKNEALSETWK